MIERRVIMSVTAAGLVALFAVSGWSIGRTWHAHIRYRKGTTR